MPRRTGPRHARFCYIAHVPSVDVYKVGASDSPPERVRTIAQQIGANMVIVALLPGGYSREVELLRRFADHRLWVGGLSCEFVEGDTIRAFLATVDPSDRCDVAVSIAPRLLRRPTVRKYVRVAPWHARTARAA